MDKDKNGKITAAEINSSHGAESIVWANHPESPAEKIRNLDANRDGVLTVSEYSVGSQKMFHMLDVDGNGVLTPAEMMIEPRSQALSSGWPTRRQLQATAFSTPARCGVSSDPLPLPEIGGGFVGAL